MKKFSAETGVIACFGVITIGATVLSMGVVRAAPVICGIIAYLAFMGLLMQIFDLLFIQKWHLERCGRCGRLFWTKSAFESIPGLSEGKPVCKRCLTNRPCLKDRIVSWLKAHGFTFGD